jgi:hypothetical protein
MQHFTQEKSSIKAANQMAQKTGEWTGTFSEPAFQRFLTSGYKSQEKNASHPGGFTIFLCHPRSCPWIKTNPGSETYSDSNNRTR